MRKKIFLYLLIIFYFVNSCWGVKNSPNERIESMVDKGITLEIYYMPLDLFTQFPIDEERIKIGKEEYFIGSLSREMIDFKKLRSIKLQKYFRVGSENLRMLVLFKRDKIIISKIKIDSNEIIIDNQFFKFNKEFWSIFENIVVHKEKTYTVPH